MEKGRIIMIINLDLEKNIFYNGILIFEGEFLNGEKNGLGKEYDYYYNGKLKFHGMFIK
jgi:antitoxin component YwqK of YwqJK toxin-antitoxin module